MTIKYKLPEEVRDMIHKDAAQSIFVERDLVATGIELLETKYAPTEYEQLLGGIDAVSPGAESHKYKMWDARGIAKWVSSGSTKIPRVDVAVSEYTSPIHSMAASYGYELQEMRAAAHAQMPLDRMRADTARRVIEEKKNTTALLGDSEMGLYGLFNQPSVPVVSATAAFSGATNAQIIADISANIELVDTQSKGAFQCDTVVLPRAAYSAANRKLNTTTEKSALELLKEKYPEVTFLRSNYLTTAGASGTTRAMFFNKAQARLKMAIPFEALPPQVEGFDTVINCHARIGSVVMPYQISAVYMDGL